MFGFTNHRKLASETSIQALRPLIGIIQNSYGLPARFWTDAYVLGFMHFSIGHFSKLATQGKISGAELGFSMADALSNLSNLNGSELAMRATALVTANDPDYNKGADDAAYVHFYSMGRLKNEDANPLVKRASEIVDFDPNPDTDRRSQIVAMMFMLSFVKEVRQRFDMET